MSDFISINTLESMVSITRFNKGEAGKIFAEVEKEGMKVVIKNNNPCCILLSTAQYYKLVELAEKEERRQEIKRRLNNVGELEDVEEDIDIGVGKGIFSKGI